MLTIARDLEASGIDRKQAEATASAIGKTEEQAATKGDIRFTALQEGEGAVLYLGEPTLRRVRE